MSQCIEWTGANVRGYGQRRHNGKVEYVHRLTWAEANGPIPAGMVVLHTCDNPPCYNLEHLFLGTQGDNMQDMAAKGRGSKHNLLKTHCKWGHEFTVENTYISPAGWRICRACASERSARWAAAHA